MEIFNSNSWHKSHQAVILSFGEFFSTVVSELGFVLFFLRGRWVVSFDRLYVEKRLCVYIMWCHLFKSELTVSARSALPTFNGTVLDGVSCVKVLCCFFGLRNKTKRLLHGELKAHTAGTAETLIYSLIDKQIWDMIGCHFLERNVCDIH